MFLLYFLKYKMALKKAGGFNFVVCTNCKLNWYLIYSALAALAGAASSVFFGNKIDWMFGKTPP